MTEDNRKGPGIFYAVVGVATLVVAIIWATFAYFSASTQTEYNNPIAGETYDELSEALSLTVTRLDEETVTATSDDLVPTDLDGSIGTQITNAVTANCEANGYTGCHLYKIVATTSQTVQNASILLDSLTVTATDATDWMYSIFTASDDQATGAALAKNAAGNAALDDANSTFAAYANKYGSYDSLGFDMHDNKTLTSTDGATYYLLIYLSDDGESQNDSTNNADNLSTGSYSGTVSLTAGAAGGKVTASFNG